ncbi:MAG: hypothetical protein IPL39_05540 [Opitutaceae bacterium]|nr:hypothetical protein [Opitutaceae bacterium]
MRNIVLRGNIFIAYESPAVPFAGSIRASAASWHLTEGWIVENNLVVTNHWHGISLYGARLSAS